MFRSNLIFLVGLLAFYTAPVLAQDASLGPLPRVLDDRLKLELFAEHPTLVTPTGIDVDHLGRVWVLESNTHFPPDGYQGHPSDRLLVLQNTDGDGKADKTTVFADGFKFAMSVAVQPVWLEVEGLGSKVEGQKKTTPVSSAPQPSTFNPQPVFVATRGEIVRLRDTNSDLVADERTRLVHLETAGNYPHNGLAGIAFDALGWMYFGFGENLGADYKIIGSDGVTLSGGGEGGNMYRCRPDGSKLEKWATGFWNPHASCFDAFGRLFTVDNDPDSRPPCRLLHIIPGGDYGYRFRNGRRGTHPFTAWNGEIPGTLPMVSGTGEAPSGLLCYESDGFPADYLGTLLVGSWGDHRIDQFVLEPKGASFVSKPKPIVQGTENFRPVGLGLAPDGSIYFSDWVLRDYKLHRKGRVWRLSAKEPRQTEVVDVAKIVPSRPHAELEANLESQRLTVRRQAAHALLKLKEGSDWETESGWDPYLPAPDCQFGGPPKRFSPRSEFELLMAETTYRGPQTDWPQRSTRHAPTNPVDAAALRLLDPIYGVSTNEDNERVLFWSWDERFEDQPEDKVDDAVWMELARHQSSLLWTILCATCGTGRTHIMEKVPAYLNAPDPFVLAALLAAASLEDEVTFRSAERRWNWNEEDDGLTDGLKVFVTLAARRRSPPRQSILSVALGASSPAVRRVAVQWVGEEKLTGFRSRVEAILNDEKLSPDLLMPCLATLSLLDGVPPAEFEKTPPVTQLMKIVADDKRPAALRATALQMVPASTAELSTKLLLEFAKSGDEGLKTQAVRTLQQSGRSEGIPLLLEIAADENADTSLRLDAIAGLCATPHDQPLPANIEQLLLDAVNNRLKFRAASEQKQCQLEAVRALRGRGIAGTKIGDALRAVRETASDDRELVEAIDLAIDGKSSLSSSDPQLSTLNPQPSPDSGRRVFYHHQGPLCFKCHTVNGRGGNVGPDLSVIARTMNREKLLGSILEPSKEISPQFLTWTILTDDGKTHTGIMVTENGGGDIELGDAQGNITKIPRKNIDERTPSNVSVMPQGLHQRMTRQELAELLDYLETLK